MKLLAAFAALLIAAIVLVQAPVVAQDKGKTPAAELTASAQKALAALVAKDPLAKKLQPKATAILVFPSVKKAGLGIGGQYGEGACSRAAQLLPSTKPPALRWASRLADSSTDTRCS
jgi:lipid-binding SYLF domain-containing protein